MEKKKVGEMELEGRCQNLEIISLKILKFKLISEILPFFSRPHFPKVLNLTQSGGRKLRAKRSTQAGRRSFRDILLDNGNIWPKVESKH